MNLLGGSNYKKLNMTHQVNSNLQYDASLPRKYLEFRFGFSNKHAHLWIKFASDEFQQSAGMVEMLDIFFRNNINGPPCHKKHILMMKTYKWCVGGH